MSGMDGLDAWITRTPAEDRGGENSCDMCERFTWNDEDETGRVFCDRCLKELEYENTLDRIRNGEY